MAIRREPQPSPGWLWSRRKPPPGVARAVLRGALRQVPREGVARLLARLQWGMPVCLQGPTVGFSPKGQLCGCPLVESLPEPQRGATVAAGRRYPVALEIAWAELGYRVRGNPVVPVRVRGEIHNLVYADMLEWLTRGDVAAVAKELVQG